MHLSIKIQIEGEFTINESLSINIEKRSKSVTIIRENNKLYLIVSKEVIDYNDKMPILNAHYFKPTPKDFFQDLIDIVRYVEAIGAEFLHLHKVFWDEFEIIWTPDVAEEEHIYPVYSYKESLSNHSSPKLISVKTLRHIFDERNKYEVLTVPMSFYRLGNRFFHNMEFKMAFIQHYLMLDYCFSNGQFETKKVIRAFLSNKTLRFGAYRYLQYFLKSANDKDITFYNKQRGIFNQYDSYKKCRKYSSHVDFLLAMLAELRGKVFHASDKTVNYVSDEEFPSLSRIIWGLCIQVTGLLRLELFCIKQDRDKLWTFNENEMLMKE